MPISKNKAKDVVEYLVLHGKTDTADHFGVSTETLNRYIRKANEYGIKDIDKSKLLSKIAILYSDEELKAIANGGRIVPGLAKVPIINFNGDRIRIGALTDTHIGSLKFSENRLFQAFEEFQKEKVDFITHSGDVCEGMSNRAGHVYELSDIGYDKQKSKAIELFSQWTDSDIYAIDGNHDRWFLKSNGALIVKDIESKINNFHFIGHDEGDIALNNNVTIKLWHGEDGNSYALSYRIQKILESLAGGEKPSVLICGHTHKYVKIFERNVYAISAGSIQSQTQWMRGKRISAHVGFCIIDIYINKNGVCKFTDTWYPFYT